MNPLNFNRTASGAAPSPGYNYLPRPSPGAAGGTTGSGSTPFNRGFPFGSSSLPPHLAGFANSGQQAAGGQQGQNSLNINDFPALGGNFNSASSGAAANLNYANSTSGGNRGVEALNTDDFPSLSDGFANGAAAGASSANTAATASQEQASAAATLQHQRLAREQNQSQTLNAARGGFGEPERDYATKVGMQQPPGMSAAQNWFSANFGGNAAVLGLNGTGQGAGAMHSPATANQLASQALDGVDGIGQRAAASNVAAGLMMPSATGVSSGATPQTAKTPAQQVLTSPADRFGLVGLLNIIKLQDPDLSMLAMGSDLQTLGLNLGAQE